ncbi:hypothetical protein [Nonomuraea insulae]|uniref:Uncharacterized protein n=1 Tax=Nonomuraea insulae TaxID=1616787 RepID=A0ABW1CRS7_9ACTN
MRRLLVALALALAAGLVVLLALPDRADRPAGMPVSPEVEQRYGVRFTMVGVTADHGLLDVRFIVLDPDHATDMLSDADRLPDVVVESRGKALPSPALMPMIHNPVAGRTYYVLYRNSGGVVMAGDTVTLAFDEARLRHVPVL